MARGRAPASPPLAAGRRPPAGPGLLPGAPWLTSSPTNKKGRPVSDWLDLEGTKYLVLAVIGLGGVIGKILVGKLDLLGDKVDKLHDDMVRVKMKLGLGHNGDPP